MTCARRLAGARRPAPSTSIDSPRRPEPRPGRFRARFFFPALALLLGALSLFHAAPASAQDVWSATLTVKSVSGGKGCFGLVSPSNNCRAALSQQQGFTHSSVAYEVFQLATYSVSGTDYLYLTLDKAIPTAVKAMTLCVDSTVFPLGSATVSRQSVAGDTVFWTGVSVPEWTVNQQVAVKLVTGSACAPSLPAAPTNLSVSPGDAKLDLRWTAPTGTVTGYDVHYTSSTTVAGDATAVSAVASGWVAHARSSTLTTATHSVTPLTNGTPYRVRVRAKNAAGDGAWVFGTGTPAMPTVSFQLNTLLVVESDTNPDDIVVLLSSAQAQAVTVGISVVATGTTATPADYTLSATSVTFAAGETSKTFTILATADMMDDGGNEVVTLRLTPPAGVGLGSNPQNEIVIVDDSQPAPTLTATPGNLSLALTWTAPGVSALNGFDVHYTSAPKTGSGAVTDDAAATGSNAAAAWVAVTRTGIVKSQTIASLTNGRAYRLRVRWFTVGVNNVHINGDWFFGTGTPKGPPVAPADLALSGFETSFEATWTASTSTGNAAPTWYEVAFDVATQPVTTLSYSARTADGAATSLTIDSDSSGLTIEEATQYRATIRACNPVCSSYAGNETVWTITREPADIANLAVTPGDGTLALSWTLETDGAAPTAYEVAYTASTSVGDEANVGTDPDTEWVDAGHSGVGTSQTITDLTNGQEYRVRVESKRVVNGSSRGGARLGFGKGTPQAASADANLSALAASTNTSASGTFSALTLSPSTFAAATLAYTATVPHARTHVRITPTVNDSNATVKVGKQGTTLATVTSGSASGAIALDVGANAITVKVTAQDGATTKTYTVTVTRQKPPAPTGLTVTPGNEQLDLTWNAPSGTVGAYAVEFTSASPATVANGQVALASQTDPAAGWVISLAAVDAVITTSHPITGLTNGTTYRVRVSYFLSDLTASNWAYDTGTPATQSTPPSNPSAPVTPVTGGDPDDGDDTSPPSRIPTFDEATVAHQSWTAGTRVTLTLPQATGGDGELTYSLNPNPPSGLTLNPDTRALNGIPDTGQEAARYSWTATDANGDSTTLTFHITVIDRIPTFGEARIADQSYRQNTAMAALVLPQATGGDGELTYSLSPNPPSGLTLNPDTRTVSGAPDTAQAATRYTWTVTDADGDTAALSFTIAIMIDSDRAQTRAAVRYLLAETARLNMNSAIEQIEARFTDPGASGVSFAGQWLPLNDSSPSHSADPSAGESVDFASPVSDRSALRFCDAPDLDRSAVGCISMRDISMTPAQALKASSFSLHSGHAGDSTAPLWSFWGRGDLGRFSGRAEAAARQMTYDAELDSAWLGVDARRGPWVGGVALSHSNSEADYSLTPHKARLQTRLTTLYPYLRRSYGPGLDLRAWLGVGSGEAHHWQNQQPAATADLSMRMAAVGLRQTLRPAAGFNLALKADAGKARLKTGSGPLAIQGLSARSHRLRAAIEATRTVVIDGQRSVAPFVEAALRRDSGDGLSGYGLEVVAGARYQAPTLSVELRARWLAAHSQDQSRERGVSLDLRSADNAQGAGWSFQVNPRWGADSGRSGALWNPQWPSGARHNNDHGSMDAALGYGFHLPARNALLTPFTQVGMTTQDTRRIQAGLRFQSRHRNLNMELAGERKDQDTGETQHVVRFDLRLRF